MLSKASKITIHSFPFNYILIEDAFDTDAAWGLTSIFNELIQNGKSVGKVGEVGELFYDAIKHTPTLKDTQWDVIVDFCGLEDRLRANYDDRTGVVREGYEVNH